MRIKCPNCGSTAQVELVKKEWDDYTATPMNEYICGCGCRFRLKFSVLSVETLEIEEP